MADLILHNYEISPFSEKVRVALGLKGLAWHSVRIPAVMPKPDVIALTGGYRKTPVLQSGNDVYCDTSLILRVLDERAPSPPLFPKPEVAAICQWADSKLFDVAVALAMRPTRLDSAMEWLTQDEMMKIQADRAAMSEGRRLSYQTGVSELPAYVARIEALIGDTDFVVGDAPSAADFSAYHCFWFLGHMCPETIASYPKLQAWIERVASIGHGTPEAMTSERALEVCRESSAPSLGESTPDPNGLALGSQVRVRASDYGRDPVVGELVASRIDEVVLRRPDDRAGDVYVHFPRIGYDVGPAK